MQETEMSAYRRGWAASKNSRTSDLDAAESRYVRKFGNTYVSAFVDGWSDYASDKVKKY